jgi:hypothetical protein
MLDPVSARYHVEANQAVRGTLSLLASLLRRSPGRASYGICGEHGRFVVEHGTNRVELPVIGRWPLESLTPHGVADTLDRLSDDARGSTTHQDALREYAMEVLCIAIATGQIDEETIRDAEGGFNVEVCFEEGTHQPFMWIATGNPEDVQWERLKVDEDLVEAPYVVPCHLFDRTRPDGTAATTMVESCSDSEGVAFPSLAVDPETFAEIARRGSRSRHGPQDACGRHEADGPCSGGPGMTHTSASGTEERPWSLEPDPSCGALLSTLCKRIAASPSETVYGVSEDLNAGLTGPMLTVRHGDLQVHLPVIDGWPLRRLSPQEIGATIDDIADACFGDGDHQTAILPYVVAAVTIAVGEGTMPEDADATSGGYAVELCMDGESDRPALHVRTLVDGEEDMAPLPRPEGPGVPFVPIPCDIQELHSSGSDVLSVLMCFHCNDSSGVLCEDVRVDAMDVLRMTAQRRPRVVLERAA